NYKIPPHWHPTMEHVTVLEGSFYMGTGEKFDEAKATELKTGGFSAIAAKTAHYAFSKDKCVIQVHAMGPFALTYINPADDPRKK
ncbi:MAG TPA: cupin domain-containing protein, partial [Chitinophagaceae bacterium]|nr:cupin domain-containing protein [Chitinophagaceae bacterium]